MPPRTFGPLSTARYTANGVAFDTIRVPPGRFVDGEGAEKRALLVSRPFEIGLTLVTQVLWQAVMSRGPSSFRGDDRPVEWVSWDDVQTFLRQLDSLGLRGFRLSTEAEWAWAARCGVAARWAGADRAKPVAVVNQDGTRLVGGLLPSAAGALDLSGNVLEWQQDWLSDSPAAGVDTEGPALESFRVSRGGHWSNDPQDARVALRDSDPPGFRGIVLGVRLFRSVP
jgi:formylglycine-generating enzyme required for sulfatase activity